MMMTIWRTRTRTGAKTTRIRTCWLLFTLFSIFQVQVQLEQVQQVQADPSSGTGTGTATATSIGPTVHTRLPPLPSLRARTRTLSYNATYTQNATSQDLYDLALVENKEEEEGTVDLPVLLLLSPPHATSILLTGVAAATVSLVYVTALGWTRHFLWHKLLPQKHGPWMLPIVTTLGGLAIGLLQSFPAAAAPFSAADFVRNPTDVNSIPPLLQHLPALLGTCLVTSSLGFSLGPEAPIVGAGVLVGGAMTKLLNGTSTSSSSLLFAGAAGALTASLNMPLAGPLFALEMVTPGPDITLQQHRHLSPAVMSSIAAYALINLVMKPNRLVGGHFQYFWQDATPAIAVLTSRQVATTALLAGVGGGLLATVFEKVYHLVKHHLWKTKKTTAVVWTMTTSTNNTTTTKHVEVSKQRQVLTKMVVGLVVGVIAMYYPQSFFWGEGILQSLVDGQKTPLTACPHGLPANMMQWACVDPALPYSSRLAALQVGVAKLMAIVLAGAAKFPGGIVFPMFAAAPAFAHALWGGEGTSSVVLPVAVISFMAATQAAATRTPLASALILAMTASNNTPLPTLLPAMLVASYLGVYVTRAISGGTSYFAYHESSSNEEHPCQGKDEGRQYLAS